MLPRMDGFVSFSVRAMSCRCVFRLNGVVVHAFGGHPNTTLKYPERMTLLLFRHVRLLPLIRPAERIRLTPVYCLPSLGEQLDC